MGSDDNAGDNGGDTAKWGGAHHKTSSGGGGPNLALIATAIILGFCVIFFAKNSRETVIDFVVFDTSTTLRWLILMSILLGVVIDRLFSIWWRRRRRKSRDNKD